MKKMILLKQLHEHFRSETLLDFRKLSHSSEMQNDALKVIFHPLYGMNNDVLIWGDWLSCGSHDSQSPHIWR